MWDRRQFLRTSGCALLAAWTGGRCPRGGEKSQPGDSAGEPEGEPTDGAVDRAITLFLCGDVMTGRGIDQVLPSPSAPELFEPYMTSARGYVELAERAHGPIPRPVGFDYIWGDAVAELAARSPDLRVINLETSVTTSDAALPKGINYRMHPGNVPCLAAAGIHCCVLANNHVLDWGVPGLRETLATLRGAGVATAGAGGDAEEAGRPAVFELAARAGGRTEARGVAESFAGRPAERASSAPGPVVERGDRAADARPEDEQAQPPSEGRVLVFGFGSPTSGIPHDWLASKSRPGVNLLPDLSEATASRVAAHVGIWKRPGDRVVASIHWGGNWGYEVPRAQRDFAHRLIEAGAADVVHGHSSHHPKGIEVYRGRLVLYGCGDFLNDYEGIAGYEEFRSELVLAYFAALDPRSGALQRLEMAPFRTRRFRLERVRGSDAAWLRATLDRECRALGSGIELTAEGSLELVAS